MALQAWVAYTDRGPVSQMHLRAPRDTSTPMEPHFRFGRTLVSRLDFGVLVILALPWALLFIGVDWIFRYIAEQRFIDSWVYFGYFLDLPTHLKVFPATYYGSRLAWILPGYVVYRSFPPLVASYILHLGVYYAAVVSLYLTLKHTVGRRPALLSAAAMGCYTYFLWAVGWNYVDGAGIAYILLTTMALTYAAQRQRPWIWLILSGAFYGGMIYSQIFLVAVTPALLLYYLVSNRNEQRYPLKLASLFFPLGFLAVSLLFGAINYKLGGDFLFYAPSVRFAIGSGSGPSHYTVPFQVWRNWATWLVFPGVALFGSVASILVAWKLRSERRARFLILFQLYFLICSSIFVLFELKGNTVLQLPYYASLLIPPVFLSVGALLAPVMDRFCSGHFVLMVSGEVAILLLSARFLVGSKLSNWTSFHAPLLLVLLALMGGALLFLKEGSVKTVALSLPFFLALALVNGSKLHFGEGLLNGSTSYFDLNTTNFSVSQQGLSAVVQSVHVIQTFERNGKTLFWYRITEPTREFYRSVSASYLWAYRLVNERFPSLAPGGDTFQELVANTQVVVLSNEKDAFQMADLALSQVGLRAQLLAERRIQEGQIGWNMILIKVRSWPFIEKVDLAGDAWPGSVQLRWRSEQQQVVPLIAPETRWLFRSDLNSSSEWDINRYGRSGGLSIQPNCFVAGDNCGVYSSGDPRDHLASPFAALPSAEPAFVFFSIWVKPLEAGVSPHVFVQSQSFATVGESQELLTRPGGWTLQGGWFDVGDAQKLRLVVMEPRGSASLLDKAGLLEIPAEALSPPAAGR
jgi:hypothetical protein